MKIAVTSIIFGHFRTLSNESADRPSVQDLLVFILVPVAAGVTCWLTGLKIPKDAYNASITVFGIFVGLLLNVQVAVFNVFQRNRAAQDNRVEQAIQDDNLVDRREVLRQLNVNISYLILVGSAGVIIGLVYYAFEFLPKVSSILTIVVYSHFLLTFLMVVKRAYNLFDVEYRT